MEDSSIKNKMYKFNDLTKEKGWVCVMENNTTIEVESFSEALQIPNKKVMMSSHFYPQWKEIHTP
jgi:hypothetical protein